MPINTNWRQYKQRGYKESGREGGESWEGTGRLWCQIRSNPSSTLSDASQPMFICVQCLLTCKRKRPNLPCSCKIGMVIRGRQCARSLGAGTWHTQAHWESQAHVESYLMLPSFKHVSQ